MVGKKVCALPIVGELDAVEAVVRKESSDFLKIEYLLLPRIQGGIRDFFQFHSGYGVVQLARRMVPPLSGVPPPVLIG